MSEIVKGTDLKAERQGRLESALSDSGCAAIIAASPANVGYATGYRSVASDVFRTHQMAAVVGPEATMLIAPVGDSAPAIDAGVPAERIVAYGRFYFESADEPPARPTMLVDEHAGFVDALAAAVTRLKLKGARLGVDVGGLGTYWNAVREALSEAELTDMTGWFAELRMEKTPAEVVLLRNAARLAETGIERALDVAAPGVTEKELAAIVAGAMVEGGGVPRFLVVTAGKRSALADAEASDYALQPGDLLRFDVGCVVDGYWSDTARTAVVGEPTPLQQSRYDALVAGEEAQLRLLRPGVAASALFAAAIETVEASGDTLTSYRRHHCGHGIGTEVYEPPTIAPDDDTLLSCHMTLNVETPYYELGWGGMMVEDTAIVTETGHELLTELGRSLRVVPA